MPDICNSGEHVPSPDECRESNLAWVSMSAITLTTAPFKKLGRPESGEQRERTRSRRHPLRVGLDLNPLSELGI
jgi:hypothetical protein